MQLVFFTVYYSPKLFLLFAGLLIALLHCAWTPFVKGNGRVPGLAYGPGIDAPLCRVSSLAGSIRDYTSLCSSGMDASSFSAWVPKFPVHHHAHCLVMLSSTVGLLLGLQNLAWSWHKSKQFVGEVTKKCAPR